MCQGGTAGAAGELAQRSHPALRRLDPGQPFLRLHGVHYSPAGDPVAYSAIDVDDGYIRFEVFRRR